MKIFKEVLLALMLLTVLLCAAGCNTTQGMGRDIQWTGEKIEEAAD